MVLNKVKTILIYLFLTLFYFSYKLDQQIVLFYVIAWIAIVHNLLNINEFTLVSKIFYLIY